MKQPSCTMLGVGETTVPKMEWWSTMKSMAKNFLGYNGLLPEQISGVYLPIAQEKSVEVNRLYIQQIKNKQILLCFFIGTWECLK